MGVGWCGGYSTRKRRLEGEWAGSRGSISGGLETVRQRGARLAHRHRQIMPTWSQAAACRFAK